MQVGDLVRLKRWSSQQRIKLHIVAAVGRWHVSLVGFADNQVFSKDDLEVVSHAGR